MRFGSSLKSWKTQPEVAAQQRHLRALQPAEVAAADDDPAARRLELLQQQADDRRLARAGRADDEDELALVDHERDVAERDHVRVVDLRHRLEHDHRAADEAAGADATSGSGERYGCLDLEVCLPAPGHAAVAAERGAEPEAAPVGGAASLAESTARPPSLPPARAGRRGRTRPGRRRGRPARCRPRTSVRWSLTSWYGCST